MSSLSKNIPLLADWRRLTSRLFLLLGIGIGGTLVYTLATTDSDSLSSLLHFQPAYLLLAMLFAVLPWLGHALRLLIWSRFLKQPLSMAEAFQIVVATDLGSAVTPTVIGGAPIKAGLLMQKGFSVGASGIMVALSSLEDIVFFAFFVPLIWLAAGQVDLVVLEGIKEWVFGHVDWIFGGGLLLIISFVGLRNYLRGHSLLRFSFFSQSFKRQRQLVKWRKHVREFRQLFMLIRREGKMAFLCSITLLGLQWLCRFSILAALMLALNLEVEWLRICMLQWMVFISMLLVPTPGATGGAEAAFILILGTLLPEAMIGILATGWRFLNYYFVLLLAILLLYFTHSNSVIRRFWSGRKTRNK